MRDMNPGQVLLATGMMGLGVLSLVFRDFALQWQPVPAWVDMRMPLTVMSGVVLLAGGFAMLIPPVARTAALILTLYLLTWVVLLQVPAGLAKPAEVASWLGMAEDGAIMCGLWTVLATATSGREAGFLTSRGGAEAARILFGIACLEFGLSHFAYADFTAQMIPAWLPARVPLAYLTGACHCAAGFALLFGILPRLAATLEAVMMGLFVLLVHVPMLFGPPTQLAWTMLFVAISLTGSATAIAWSLRDAPLPDEPVKK